MPKKRAERKKPPQSEQGLLPGYRDFQQERRLAIDREVERLGLLIKSGSLSGDKLLTATMLVYCGLPIKQTDESSITRTAKIGEKSFVRVTFSQTNEDVPLPFGADRTLLFFLTDKAVTEGPILKWDKANEYMRLFDMDPDSGKNYREVQGRFIRLVYVNLLVEFLDGDNQVVDSWKCPLIDHAKIAAEISAEGKWKPTQTIAEILRANEEINFGARFYNHLKVSAMPIPLDILRVAGKQYRLMDYMLFLYLRSWSAHTESYIPWDYLRKQFDDTDANPWRWPSLFRKALTVFKAMPYPADLIAATVTSKGITIKPLPLGTEFFPGFPKVGFKREKKGSPALQEPIPDAVMEKYPDARRLVDPNTGEIIKDRYLVGNSNMVVNETGDYRGQVGVTITFRKK